MKNRGLETIYTDDIVQKDSVFPRGLVDPIFPGAEAAYKKFQNKNVRIPWQIKNLYNSGHFEISVRFFVDMFGNVSDVSTTEFYGNVLEQEALGLIKKSGKWIPATLHSRTIGNYTQ